MSTGMQTIVRKTTEGWSGVVVAKGPSWDASWVTIAVIGDIAEGPSILHAQMYAKLPTPTADRPRDIETRWLRASANDATAREKHEVGSYTTWADTKTSVETIKTEEDLPLHLQMRHNGAKPFTVTTLITKMFAPAAYVAERIAP